MSTDPYTTIAIQDVNEVVAKLISEGTPVTSIVSALLIQLAAITKAAGASPEQATRIFAKVIHRVIRAV